METPLPRKTNWGRIGIIAAAIMAVIGLLMCAGLVYLYDAATGQLPSQQPIAVGAPAPDFTLPGLSGEGITLSHYRSRPVVMSFGASWCPDCQLEAPELEGLHQRYSEDQLIVLLIDTNETKPTALRFANQYGLTIPVGLDENGKVSDAYHVYAIPMMYFIDRQGIIRFTQLDYDPVRTQQGLEAIGLRN